VSVPPVPFVAEYAGRQGFRYRPDADERWLRAWEPFATLRTPVRYEHTVEATGDEGSFTISRVVMTVPSPTLTIPEGEASAWIAIVQDPKIDAVAAGTSDAGLVFGESRDLVVLPRRPTGDERFDLAYATFARDDAALSRAVTPSLRRLLLGWRLPLHFELRLGGFVLAPVGLRYDADSLAWLVRSLPLFGQKAVKRAGAASSE
jgi:hypothetical protein